MINNRFSQPEAEKIERQVFFSLRVKSLSQEEKRVQRDFLIKSMHTSVYQPHLSYKPSFKPSLLMNILIFFTQRSFVLSALSIVAVIGSGLGVARASESALPGQTLYPMKINVNEPLIAKLKFSDTARIDWERELVGRRITEAETLSEQGKLGDIEKMQIEQELYEHRRTLEEIEGHEIDDDDFFPESVKSEMKNVNVRVEYNAKETFIHIEERFETEEDERKEALSGYVDDDEDEEHIFVDIYSEQGIKMKNVKKTEVEEKKEEKTEKKIIELKKQRESRGEKQDVKKEKNDSDIQKKEKFVDGDNDIQNEEDVDENEEKND